MKRHAEETLNQAREEADRILEDARTNAEANLAAAARQVRELERQRESVASYLEEMRGVLGGAAPQVAVLSEAISTALNTPDESEGGERAEAETRAEAEDEAEDAETADDEESSAKTDDAQTEVMIGLANDIKAAGPAPAPPAPPAPARRSASPARPRRNTTKKPARQRA